MAELEQPEVEPDHPVADRQVLGAGGAGRHRSRSSPTARARSCSPCSWSATSTRSGRRSDGGKVEVPGGHGLHQGRPLRGARSATPRRSPGQRARALAALRGAAASASGSSARASPARPASWSTATASETLIPLRIEPRGIIEPFAWLLAAVSADGRSEAAGTVWVEQAIFTSLPRRGTAGYHVVARSPGVSESEAASLATWSPSHGGLIVDASNRVERQLPPAARRPIRPLADLRGAGRVQRPGRAAALHPRPGPRGRGFAAPATSRSPSIATPWRWGTSSTDSTPSPSSIRSSSPISTPAAAPSPGGPRPATCPRSNPWRDGWPPDSVSTSPTPATASPWPSACSGSSPESSSPASRSPRTSDPPRSARSPSS